VSELAKIIYTASATLIGGVLLIVLTRFLEYWQQRLSLMSALIGELRAIVAWVNDRHVLEALERVIERIQREKKSDFLKFWFSDIHSLVFRQNTDKLGWLRAPLPQRIVEVYYVIESAVLELEMLFNAYQGGGEQIGKELREDWQRCLRAHQRVLELATKARADAAKVINDLEAKLPWWARDEG
jgi:hypothetical protein